MTRMSKRAKKLERLLKSKKSNKPKILKRKEM